MKYVPKDIPEGINVQRGHPLKDFVKLLGICLVGVVFIYGALGFVSDQITQNLSLRQEIDYFGGIGSIKSKFKEEEGESSDKLKDLVNKLWAHTCYQSPI